MLCSVVFIFSGLERVLDDSIANGATFAEGSVGFLATHVLREKCRFDGHRTYYYGGHVDEKRQQQHECSRQQHQNSSPRRRRHHDHEDDDFTTERAGCEVIDSICEAGVGKKTKAPKRKRRSDSPKVRLRENAYDSYFGGFLWGFTKKKQIYRLHKQVW